MYLKEVVCESSGMILFSLTFIINLWCMRVCVCTIQHTIFTAFEVKNQNP